MIGSEFLQIDLPIMVHKKTIEMLQEAGMSHRIYYGATDDYVNVVVQQKRFARKQVEGGLDADRVHEIIKGLIEQVVTIGNQGVKNGS